MAGKKKLNFEQAIDRLEKVVQKLEDSEISLDEAITLYQEGRELGKDCSKRLEEVEQKVRLLIEKEDGSVQEQDLENAETAEDM